MSVPIPAGEFERLLALARYEMMDTGPEASFDRVTALTARMLDMPLVAIHLVDHDRVWRKSQVGLGPGEMPRSQALCSWTIMSDEVNVVPDIHRDPRFRDMDSVSERPDLHTYAGAPLITPGGQRVGTLCVLDTRPRDFGSAEQEVLRSFASIIVTEMELRMRNSELEREVSLQGQNLQNLERFQTHADALAHISERLEDDDLEASLQAVAEVLGSAADLEWAGLLRFQDGTLDSATAWTRPGLDLSRLGERDAYRQGVTWEVLQSGQPLFIDDYRTHPQAHPSFLAGGLRAAAWLPLGAAGGVKYLMLAVRLNRDAPWLLADRALFQAAASIIGRALERLTYLQEVEAAANRDSLTDVGNRRAFDAALAALDVSGADFTAVMLDLDGLKSINDSQGHERGDQVLSLFAAALAREFRASDGVYRLGGDEFAVLLSAGNTLPEHEIFERMHWAVRVLNSENFTQVDASVGVASRKDASVPAAQTLKWADERMYVQKRGRKRERIA
ncbi:diguanylate cyclase (plasmid) [Deinococcus sp. KNUC1210]|uniref:sensor domain-containing diguanylate cyclase n=1 Tax=Deinococcus sp. KNUC1210 TaxID=2917691 RepID=UPI001EF14516|nr:diguanylate cyclase [Deinococcus sp. KNUC1210]ULH14216.1 diguanylate cyclase [Deinococcus sp. KNUC1210]